ncbi:MAG: hypothetical protein EBV83_09435, partial [Verrucomicrobia bacterium]|nr:hypothetical protein [Verrucomicrobiota bacterium]
MNPFASPVRGRDRLSAIFFPALDKRILVSFSFLPLYIREMGCGLLIMTIVGWVTLGRAEGDIPKPNVLILLTDDQGWGDLGVQGAKDVGTP